MKKAKISLNTIDKVKDFISVTSELDCDFDLALGRKVIDGKSLMGIFSLDLSKPIEMYVNTNYDDDDDIMRALEEFIIME